MALFPSMVPRFLPPKTWGVPVCLALRYALMAMAHGSRLVSPARERSSVTAAMRPSGTHSILCPNSSDTYRAGIMVRPLSTYGAMSI